MTHSTNTETITLNLDSYLKTNNYFDTLGTSDINHQIVVSWDTKFKDAISKDLKERFANLELDIIYSEFELSEEKSQGGPCTFFHRVIITDNTTLEFLRINIRTLINYNKTTVYLDSGYADINKYQGKSNTLKEIFEKLKSAEGEDGYFNPILLKTLVNN